MNELNNIHELLLLLLPVILSVVIRTSYVGLCTEYGFVTVTAQTTLGKLFSEILSTYTDNMNENPMRCTKEKRKANGNILQLHPQHTNTNDKRLTQIERM